MTGVQLTQPKAKILPARKTRTEKKIEKPLLHNLCLRNHTDSINHRSAETLKKTKNETKQKALNPNSETRIIKS